MDDLADILGNLSSLTRDVNKMLRAEMITLRSPLGEQDDVVDGVNDLLSDFQQRWGIPVSVRNECVGHVMAGKYAQLQLVRIVNESLQNVLRHARADNVTATLSTGPNEMRVSILDDGMGFNPGNVPEGHLGLRIMRERAASAGGTLSVSSSSAGTEVVVAIPAQIV